MSKRDVLSDLKFPCEYRHGTKTPFDWLLWRYTEQIIPGKSDGAISRAVQDYGDALRAYLRRRTRRSRRRR